MSSSPFLGPSWALLKDLRDETTGIDIRLNSLEKELSDTSVSLVMESGHMEQEFNKLSATVSTLINDFKHLTEEHVLPLQAHYSTLFHSYHACQCRGGHRPQ